MTALYHGGVRRLHVGSVLLPPVKTGAASQADFGNHVARRDRVYVTTERDQAELFALLAPPDGNGDLYEVEPIGDLEIDPDYHGPGASYAVPMAHVVRVVRRRVTDFNGVTAAEALALIASTP